MNDFFQWHYVFYLFPKILAALPVTLSIVFVATLLGIALGLLITFIRLERIPVLNQFSEIYVSFIRGTPVFIQMFIVYYALPLLLMRLTIDISGWNKITFIYITYGMNTAAFFSETFRAAILSIPKTQRDAAAAVGLTKRQTYQKIILPQAIRIALPNVGTLLVGLLQDTSLAFSLGVIDVMGKVKALAALTYRSIEGYFVAAIIFVCLSLLLEKGFSLLESRLSYQSDKKKTCQEQQSKISGSKAEVPISTICLLKNKNEII